MLYNKANKNLNAIKPATNKENPAKNPTVPSLITVALV
jgi:hypothetical protein